MKITREFIHKGLSITGVCNKKQLKAIGLTWPPVKGWIDSVIGKEISDADADIFLRKEINKTINQLELF